MRSKIDSHPSTTKSERIINMTVPVNHNKQANPKQTAKSPHQQHKVIIEKHKSNVASNGDLSKLVNFTQNESRFTTPITSLR